MHALVCGEETFPVFIRVRRALCWFGAGGLHDHRRWSFSGGFGCPAVCAHCREVILQLAPYEEVAFGGLDLNDWLRVGIVAIHDNVPLWGAGDAVVGVDFD